MAQDRAKNNDFKQLFLEMYPRLVRYAVSLLGDGNSAAQLIVKYGDSEVSEGIRFYLVGKDGKNTHK